ncbi:MAG: transcriptional repressor [Myxococcota bacterium]
MEAVRASTRRNWSRQRTRILELVRASPEHPTAARVHGALRGLDPHLSLGTVYRNLEILSAQGEIRAVPTPNGSTRYDGNPKPHHHFTCEACGEIVDVDLRLPAGLTTRVRRRYGVKPTRFRIDFYGLCGSCTDVEPTEP